MPRASGSILCRGERLALLPLSYLCLTLCLASSCWMDPGSPVPFPLPGCPATQRNSGSSPPRLLGSQEDCETLKSMTLAAAWPEPPTTKSRTILGSDNMSSVSLRSLPVPRSVETRRKQAFLQGLSSQGSGSSRADTWHSVRGAQQRCIASLRSAPQEQMWTLICDSRSSVSQTAFLLSARRSSVRGCKSLGHEGPAGGACGPER